MVTNEGKGDFLYLSDGVIVCPKCGSKQVEFVTYQANTKFKKNDALCGYCLFGLPGFICGVKDTTEAKTVRKCKICGYEF